MGYRSHVIFAITEPAEVQLVLQVPKVKTLLSEADYSFHKTRGPLPEDKFTLYEWDHIKWYESFDEIKQLDHWMAETDEESFGFIRQGEECSDLEVRGSYWAYGLYYGVGHEKTPSLPKQRKAVATCLKYLDTIASEELPEDLKKAMNALRHLRLP